MGRTLLLLKADVLLLVVGVVLAGCSGDGSAGSGEESPTSEADRSVKFAACMRENGVDEFPDPSDDGSLMLRKGSGIDPESPEFQKAMEACRDLSPEAGEADGEPADLAKATEWAQCVRDNGVSDFPDPKLDGNTLVVDMTGVGTGGEDPTLDNALEVCEEVRPSGNLTMRGSGPAGD